MDIAATIEEARSLSIEDRLRLVDGIWESIFADSDEVESTSAERQFIHERLTAYLARPDEAVPWETVKADAPERTRR
jgi:putative addiction module component (TIGR02574 family)